MMAPLSKGRANGLCCRNRFIQIFAVGHLERNASTPSHSYGPYESFERLGFEGLQRKQGRPA